MKKIIINNRFFIEPDRNEIVDNDRVIKISPKHMQVLLLLIENKNEVLTRSFIFEKIWGDLIVVEESLTRAISEIRKIFCDDAKNPQVVKTIPKKGYCLLADVSFEDFQSSKNKIKLAKTMGLTFLSILIFALFFIYKESPYSLIFSEDVLKITSYRGLESGAAINNSADEILFFIENSSQLRKGLYIKKIKTEELVLIDTANCKYPDFSDSRDVVIYVKNENEIIESSKWGKTKRSIYKVNENERIIGLDLKGEKIAFLTENSPTYRVNIFDISNFKNAVVYESRENHLIAPLLSENLKFLYFIEHKLTGNTLKKYEIDTKNAFDLKLNINFIKDIDMLNENILISSFNRIFLFNENLEKIEELKKFDFNIDGISVSSRGTVLINESKKNKDIWSKNLRTGTNYEKVNSVLNDYQPITVKESESLFYISNRCGSQNFWMSSQNDEEHPLTRFTGGRIIDYDISRDGHFIYFVREENLERELYKLNTFNRKLTQLSNNNSYKIAVLIKNEIPYYLEKKKKSTLLYRISESQASILVKKFNTELIDMTVYKNIFYFIEKSDRRELKYFDGEKSELAERFNGFIRNIQSYDDFLLLGIEGKDKQKTVYKFYPASSRLEFLGKLNLNSKFSYHEKTSNLYFDTMQKVYNTDVYLAQLHSTKK